MRITKKKLVRLAEQQALRYASDADVVAVYLIGSVQTMETPLLGGTTDIDLVVVHSHSPALPREIVPLSNEIHLDVLHRAQQDYEPARSLRDDPWLGYEIYAPHLLHENGHFFEFTQAAVRAEFHAPRHRLNRWQRLYESGRDAWMNLQFGADGAEPGQLLKYLQAVEYAANAFVAFDDQGPLSERRFVTDFAVRAAAQGETSALTDLLTLLHGGASPAPEILQSWLPLWMEAYHQAVLRATPYARIHGARQMYYARAMTELLEGDMPYAALWTFLLTWTQAVLGLNPDSPLQRNWLDAVTALRLTGDEFSERLDALDAFLDKIELKLEKAAAENGLSL